MPFGNVLLGHFCKKNEDLSPYVHEKAGLNLNLLQFMAHYKRKALFTLETQASSFQ